jgi:hypothetical protein
MLSLYTNCLNNGAVEATHEPSRRPIHAKQPDRAYIVQYLYKLPTMYFTHNNAAAAVYADDILTPVVTCPGFRD